MAGLLVVIPAAAAVVWGSAKVGLLSHDAGLIACLRMALVFAGLAAVLTGGGVGRLAAQASIEGRGGRRRAMRVAAQAMAAGGAAVTLIAAIPHGGLPDHPLAWVGLVLAGAMGGAASGVVIGAMCSGEMPTLQELGVWPPTEWPLPLPWPFDDDDDDKEPEKGKTPPAPPKDPPP